MPTKAQKAKWWKDWYTKNKEHVRKYRKSPHAKALKADRVKKDWRTKQEQVKLIRRRCVLKTKYDLTLA